MIIVQKYGGSSVATTDKLKRVAELVVAKKRAGHEVVVVVSAMGDETDELLALAKKVSDAPPRRELDMLLSCGERISMALLAMAISALGEEAVSLTGSQSGIITNDNHFAAKIIEVRPFRIEDELRRGKIVIVAGYQGMSYRREVTTLGRGGSDTTAVALAAALAADACEIYSDVEGVLSADPRLVPEAKTLPALSYAEMIAFAGAGAKILNAQAVAFAQAAKIKIHAKKTQKPEAEGTVIEDAPPREKSIAGVARKTGVWLVTLAQDKSATLFTLAKEHRAAIDHVYAGDALHAWLDLENTTDETHLRQALENASGKIELRDVVSAIGRDFDPATLAALLAAAPKSAAFHLRRDALCVAVGADESEVVLQRWHGLR